jgi:DNA-binding beta-propeller fold protein YncE
MWGTYGTGAGQFIAPWGVAVDAAGYVYVADQGNNRICRFTGTGEFVLSWGSYGTGPGQFDGPSGIAADATGRIFVADYGNNRVEVFTSEGAFLNQFGSDLQSPYDVTVGPSGTVYVADHGNHRVAEYDGTGVFISALATDPLPTGVAVDVSGNIFVASEAGPFLPGDRVSKYDPSGNLLMTFGSEGTDPGYFNGPAGLAVDPAGSIYVADHANHRVQKFDSNGTLLSYWGMFGDGPGEFRYTLDVAIGPDGSIYVSDAGGSRVQKFGYAPTPVASVTWGSMKARYRAERGATQPGTQDR